MNVRILIGGIALLAAVIFGVSRQSIKNKKQETVTKITESLPDQFVVVLDLSDRLIQPGQPDADKELILKVLEEFEKKAKSHLLMNSKDRFQICIAPQKNLPFDKEMLSESLTIDFSKIIVANRVKELNEFKNSMKLKLDDLYSKAFVGKESKDYQGSNIWQFFNENLPQTTSPKYDTKVFVLTDGYFDFEEGNAKLKMGNKSTTTAFLSQIRDKDNWKEIIEKNDIGILPISKELINTSVCVAGIRSKNFKNLYEVEMLSYIWMKWLKEIGISNYKSKTIMYDVNSVVNNQIENFIQSY